MILLNFEKTIKGDSTIDKHKDWITCDQISCGVGRSISSSGGGKSREPSDPSFSEITMSKTTDKASADLFFQAAGGKSLGKAEIHWVNIVDNKAQIYMILDLHETMISSYSMDSSGDRPTETFSLNFIKIEYTYHDYDGDKKTTGTPKKWDLMGKASF